MQKKKLSVIIVIAAAIILGWYLSIRKFSGVDIQKQQDALVEQADGYAAKKLYVRAIPLYREALSYDTGSYSEIQEKLLETYYEYGDMSSYVKLAESRMAENTAVSEEYLKAADYYLSGYNYQEAMETLKNGIEKLGSDTLKEYYEEKRYAYEVSTTAYEEIVPTADNSRMPAYDGEKWEYIDEKGRDIQIGSFEEAFPFNADGYAVAARNGQYQTILSNGDLYGIDEEGAEAVYALDSSRVLAKYNGKYSYYNYDFESLTNGSHQYLDVTVSHDGAAAVRSESGWGIIAENGEVIVDFTLEDAAVNSLKTAFMGGHAMVKGPQGWYLADTQGKALTEYFYADAKAPESADGYIAVADDQGKWGFIDLTGELVIAYQYDDAKSFSDGVAAVCLGERWEYISKQNKTVIDLSLDMAQPFHGGTAQAHFADHTILIHLDYYEE